MPRTSVGSATGTRTIALAQDAALELSLARLSVVVESGPDKGRTAILSSTSLTIGSGEGNDLILSDRSVSRRHLVLTCEPDGVRAHDQRSKNGTWIERTRIETAIVPDGARLRLGSSTLVIHRTAGRLIVHPDELSDFHGLIGNSRPLREIINLVRQLAPSDLPVLIQGETGTGKERVARALHAAGLRASGPFVVLDCGAIVPGLLRSELFGHEKGAFTGADQTHQGLLVEGTGGTILLDEVGEIDPAVQPQLLRALESREITAMGSRRKVAVDVRVLSATNRDLESACAEGSFRSDLFFRLSCVRIHLPPLRERQEDIPMLVHCFLEACARRHGLQTPPIDDAAMHLLVHHSWPGNVRQLKNVVETLAVLSRGEPVEAQSVRPWLSEKLVQRDARGSQEQTLEQIERQALATMLERTGWNRTETARRLGIAASTLYEKIKRYRLSPGAQG